MDNLFTVSKLDAALKYLGQQDILVWPQQSVETKRYNLISRGGKIEYASGDFPLCAPDNLLLFLGAVRGTFSEQYEQVFTDNPDVYTWVCERIPQPTAKEIMEASRNRQFYQSYLKAWEYLKNKGHDTKIQFIKL